MNLILFDNKHQQGMLPLTFTRPQAEIRCGILTVKEKWEKHFNCSASYLTNNLLSKKFTAQFVDDNVFVSASLLPDAELASAILSLKSNTALVVGDELLAARGESLIENYIQQSDTTSLTSVEYTNEVGLLDKTYKLISFNQSEIKKDFELITKDRKSQPISETVTLVGSHKDPTLANNVFIEEGAEVEYCYINPKAGPVYIGKNAIIHEGAMIQGPCGIGESSQISMGAKLHSGVVLGPWCKVGGEVGNSIITGYSNKVHDGYLGDSVLGEWCNLGADTNTSNLKNDYAKVKLWDYSEERFARTGLQFCGLIMGDYSRCAINTSFNSGTVVGVASNIFGSGFPRNFVPSFVIGGPQGYKVNGLKAAERVGKTAMLRRNIEMSSDDIDILSGVFETTKKYRSSFK